MRINHPCDKQIHGSYGAEANRQKVCVWVRLLSEYPGLALCHGMPGQTFPVESSPVTPDQRSAALGLTVSTVSRVHLKWSLRCIIPSYNIKSVFFPTICFCERRERIKTPTVSAAAKHVKSWCQCRNRSRLLPEGEGRSGGQGEGAPGGVGGRGALWMNQMESAEPSSGLHRLPDQMI